MRHLYRYVLALVAIFMLAGATAAHADTTYLFEATPRYNGFSDFSLQYLDKDHDALFSLDELIAGTFSGVTIANGWFPAIMYVPTNDPNFCPLTDGDNFMKWVFKGGPAGFEVYDPMSVVWTYSQAPVPLPATVLLLGSGLIPLAWARRKKRLGK